MEQKVDITKWDREEIFDFFSGISVEVNHRLIDGCHIGLFAEELTRLIHELEV